MRDNAVNTFCRTRRMLVAATGVLALLALAGGAGLAAPVPKDAGKGDPTPDLKATFDTIAKAVKDEKWPAEADEKKLKGSVQQLFERMLKAAEQKERKLPVDFANLKKCDPVKEFKETSIDGAFVIAENVRVTSARNSVIFASGDVQITGATNCIIIAQNLRCTVLTDGLAVAGEYIRLNGADKSPTGDGCVLVAGQWIRTTTMDGTICHVLRPSGLPSPDEGRFAGNRPQPAIRTNGAKGVIYLNDRDDTSANGPKDCTYLPQKTPIAK